jgi:hypothetical protein
MSRTPPEWIGKTPDTKVPPHVRMRIFQQRLLNKMIPEPMSGCWLWLGAMTKKGYGHMLFNGRYEKAHRISYLIHCGPIPPGQVVCHSCDNPSCINPDHLWVGSTRDNQADSAAKGRRRNGITQGEANHFSKLSQSDVDAIRAAPRVYGSGRRLAERYGVREATISEIRSEKSWRSA